MEKRVAERIADPEEGGLSSEKLNKEGFAAPRDFLAIGTSGSARRGPSHFGHNQGSPSS